MSTLISSGLNPFAQQRGALPAAPSTQRERGYQPQEPTPQI
ncbi:hypothetical protein [Brachybacterium equifaecis]|nr:hypothetical protein [Brachybacterium equifaecis]